MQTPNVSTPSVLSIGRRLLAGLAVLLTSASVLTPSVQAQVVIADSVADFSGVQGQDNWYYQNWYQPLGFINNMAWDADTSRWLDSSGAIFLGGSHPHSTDWRISQVWVSEVSGNITVSGSVSLPSEFASGVTFQILTNYNMANLVYSQSLDATQSYNFSVSFDVSAGDTVLFSVIGDDGISFDNTLWNAQVSVVPEPTAAMLAFGAIGFISLRRHRIARHTLA